MRRLRPLCVLLLLVLAAPMFGQQAGQTGVPGENSAPASDYQIKLGDSSVKLNGPWKFHTGDDTAWANPAYDDAGWESIDLTVPRGAAAVGWSRQGHAGYAGYAWYRLKVNVTGATRQLALKMPNQADDAYQVYVNGDLVGQLGKFDEHRVKAYPTVPEAFPFPREIRDGTVTIAIRMWMDSATRFSSPDAGGLHGPPTLGYATPLNQLVQLEYDEMAQFLASAYHEVLILFMALVMTLALYWQDREETSYLWLAFVCVVTLASDAIVISVNFIPWILQTPAVVFTEVVPGPLRIGLWVLFWGYWFRLARISRLHAVVWPLVGVLLVCTAMVRAPLYGQIVPTHYASIINPILEVVKLALGALMFLITFRGIRTQKTEGWMAVVAVLLVFIANYQREMRVLHIPTAFSVIGFAVSLGTIATVSSLLIITVMLLRRFIQSQARKEQWKLEIEQAQQVQQVLIPNELPQIAGLAIDSVYRPAREVGGDFFQILPLNPPGTALIVVGDVTGKGVQAGMLVALIVGAVRAAVQHSMDPARILTEVNEQLCERQHAVATCLMMRIDPDGTVTIANAGQLPPYLNGTEFEMEGAFPIGMIPEADFSVATLMLAPGNSLFLMSDGVVEAQDEDGTLFGFDRVGEMLQGNASSAAIADAAQHFGQEDDILVLQIRREAGGGDTKADQQQTYTAA